MKKKDIVFLTVAGTLIVVSSILLWLSYARETDRATTKQIATITFKRRTAQRKYFQQPVWELLFKDSPVFNRDKIRTSKDSLSIVHLDTDIKLELGENTLIYLEVQDGSTQVHFDEGRIYIRNDSGDPLDIFSGKSRVTLNDTHALLSRSDSDSGLEVGVTKGTARMYVNGTINDISDNQTAAVDSDTVTIHEYAITLKSPQQNSFNITPHDTVDIEYTWSADTVDSFILQISETLEFSDALVVRSTQSNSHTVPLPPGDYYWQVLGADGESTSPVYACTVLRDYPVTPHTPNDEALYTYYTNPPAIHFRWGISPLASKYRLEIAEAASFDKLHSAFVTETQSRTVDTLNRGNYYWRVVSLYGFGRTESMLAGPPRRFTVEKTDSIAQPRLIAPETGHSISSDFFTQNDLSFHWEGHTDIERYMLEISNDRTFQNILISRESTGSYTRLEDTLSPGTYYWRLSYYDEAGNTQKHTREKQFTVTRDTEIRQISPEEHATRFVGQNIRLRWEDNSSWNHYRVELSKDNSFDSLEQELETSSPYADISVPQPGTYYWRVLRINPDGSTIPAGSHAMFTAGDSQEVPEHTAFRAPEPGSRISMDSKDHITFTWTEEIGAAVFSLYADDSETPIFTQDIQGNSMQFDSLTLLDRGHFRAEIRDAGSGTTITETDFTITLSPLETPELKTRHIYLPEE